MSRCLEIFKVEYVPLVNEYFYLWISRNYMHVDIYVYL